MKRRMISLVVATVLVCGLAACGSSNQATTGQESVVDVASSEEDGKDIGVDGADQAKEQLMQKGQILRQMLRKKPSLP